MARTARPAEDGKGDKEMKAYNIRNKYDGFITEVIFAETAGKAKSYALTYCESFEESFSVT